MLDFVADLEATARCSSDLCQSSSAVDRLHYLDGGLCLGFVLVVVGARCTTGSREVLM